MSVGGAHWKKVICVMELWLMSGQSEATVEDLASSNSISYMTFFLWLVDENRGVEG